ncbi:MAG: ParA family protein [Romboutsia sp.]|nr:ParA family protein [Romboutsia sp.]MBP3929484.1 ParA family protein [Peptostreptococcaceae bacterium]
MKIIMFGASKGGTGKTTMCYNIASEYAKRNPNKKVAIIDSDKQANTTSFFGYSPTAFKDADFSSYLLSQVTSEEIMIKSEESDNLFLMPASRMHRINQSCIENSNLQSRYTMLREVMEKDEYIKTFDVLFVDTHPGIDLFNMNIIDVADIVIHVLKAGCRHSLDSLRTYKEDFEVDRELNDLSALDAKWYCIVNQFKNNKASKAFMEYLKNIENLDQDVLENYIRESTALIECALTEKAVVNNTKTKKTQNAIEDIENIVSELENKNIL